MMHRAAPVALPGDVLFALRRSARLLRRTEHGRILAAIVANLDNVDGAPTRTEIRADIIAQLAGGGIRHYTAAEVWALSAACTD